ncbi:MAG: T9SS C-terminal target domain-containing protein [Bacteroidetes bacterium]|nr:MAG: T9SS C-terminal target domain-containing protein [Bacteroidota bacterium]
MMINRISILSLFLCWILAADMQAQVSPSAATPVAGVSHSPFQSKMKSGHAAGILPRLNIRPFHAPARRLAPPFASSYQPLAPNFRLSGNVPAHVHSLHTNETGLPIFISSQGSPAARKSFASEEDIRLAALLHLQELGPLMRIAQPEEEFEPTLVYTDELGITHARMQQYYLGIPVYGAEVIVHFDPSGEILVNGRYQPTPRLSNIAPALSEAEAIAIGRQHLARRTLYRELTQKEKELLQYDQPLTELYIFPLDGYVSSQRLAYHLTYRPNFVERWEYIIDAHSGEVLHFYNHTCSMGPATANGTHLNGSSHIVNTFQLNNGVFVLLDATKNMYKGAPNAEPRSGDGFILTVDMKNTHPQNPQFEEVTSNNNTWTNLEVSAHVNSSIAYDYFETTFRDRNNVPWTSINGQGGDVIAFINVADENGRGLDNAFWNGTAMFYGNGDQAFSPLAGAIDVGGHEMGHGVIQATANLEYQGESGALNESYADIFGSMIDRDDWTLGEEVVNPAVFRSGALRDMSNPHNGGSSLNDNGYQPAHYNERFTGREDNGGVHINSGINNRAFFLVASAVGKDKAEQIYWRALRDYLGRSSQFIDMRLAAERAAGELYGNTEANAVRSAYDQVGIIDNTGGQGSGTPTDIEVNPGQDYLIVTSTDPNDANTLYRSDPQINNIQPLSQTEPKRPISITDDGDVGYFVGKDGHIRGLFTNPAFQTNEQILSTDPFWDNVAVSKDGNLAAAVSTQQDTSIYVFNLANGQAVKYRLYNPTTVQGVQTGDVLFADAIQWDYSGEYVMYDAFNRIPNANGADVEYWDVGFIRVWDMAANDFGDGSITKLFTNLPEGISIGNANFAKNSPFIITFDLYDENDPATLDDDEVFVMAANIETGDIGTLFQNTILGFPSYSKLDDRVVFGALNNNGDTIVAQVQLAPDKINVAPNTQATGLIGPSKYPVWYVVGERNTTATDPLLAAELQLRAFPNPFEQELQLDLVLQAQSRVEVGLYDLMGRKVKNLHTGMFSAGKQRLELQPGRLSAGVYTLAVQVNERQTFLRLVRR